jgi:hypothetical protein
MGRLTVAQIRESLERSGYLMEQRIAPSLEQQGYFVTRNLEYEDPDTGKSREIDLHALRVVLLSRPRLQDLLTQTVIASCKNNHLPIVLFTYSNPLRGIIEVMEIPKVGFPLTVKTKDEIESIESFLNLGRSHHFYGASHVARQYCRIKETKAGTQATYMADHGELQSDIDSLIRAVNAEILDFKQDPEYLREFRSSHSSENDINLNFIYPVVILAGDMYDCRQTRKGVTIKPSNHILFVREVKSRSIKGEFCVDFIRESYLGRYLAHIDLEFEFIEKRMKANRRRLRREVAREIRDLPVEETNIPDSSEATLDQRFHQQGLAPH